ncbi:MAG: S41 family peptidase [Bacteroidota bacterium]
MRNYLLLLVISSLPLAFAQAQEWLNLDFESPENQLTQLPENWQHGRLIDSTILVKAPAVEGQAILLQGPFSDRNSGYAYQEAKVEYPALTQFKVTGRIKTQDVSGEGAYLYAYGKQGDAYLGYTLSDTINGTKDWSTVSFTFVGDPRMEKIRLGCYLGGSGKAWFDDLKWEQLPFSEPKLSADASIYLDSFFHTVSTLALDKESFDWKLLREEAELLSGNAEIPEDTYAAIRYCLGKINKHSRFIDPRQAALWASGGNSEDNPVLPPIEYCHGYRVDEDIAYLSMPGLGSGHQPTLTSFADSLQQLIASLDGPQIKGWVVDLRNNTGGNCWPMLAGIGPLLGEGICGYFMDRDGSNAVDWSYREGSSFNGEYAATTVSDTPYQLQQPLKRIAVLTGPQTASSGEITAIAFRGLPQVQSFGQPTAGYSTTNATIRLPDGAMLLLTISIYGDRNKVPFGEQIYPDVLVAEQEGEDLPLLEALHWLRE